eukprot:scaffold5528_cov27-Tisochrysis_lutea.AAC.4
MRPSISSSPRTCCTPGVHDVAPGFHTGPAPDAHTAPVCALGATPATSYVHAERTQSAGAPSRPARPSCWK